MSGKFVRDLLSVFKSRVAIILIGLGSSIVSARFLGPEGNGVIAAILVYPTLFMSIGSLGIRQSTTYYIGQEKQSVEAIYGAALTIWMLTSAISVSACFVLIEYVTKQDFTFMQVFLVLIAIPFSLYNTYTSGIFLGKQNIREFNKINWLPALINFVVTFLLVGPIPLGVAGSLTGSFLSVFIMAILVFIKLKKNIKIHFTFDWKLIRGMLSLGLVYAVSWLVVNLNYKADVVLLERYSTQYELGIYSRGVSLVQYLWEIPLLLSTIIHSRSAGAKDSQSFSLQVCRLLRFAMVAIFLASVALYVVAGILVYVLFGEAFAGSVSVLRLLIPGIFFLTFFQVLNQDLLGKGKPWLSLFAMIPALILNVVLNIWWIPEYGANGSALASTISYTLAGIGILLVYSKYFRIPMREILSFTKEDFSIVRDSVQKLRGRAAS